MAGEIKIIGSGNLGYLISKMKAAFLPKSNLEQVGVDSAPVKNSTNLIESGGVYSSVYPAVQSTIPAGGMLPNVKYKLGTLTGTVTLTLASASDATIENEYKFTFSTSSTAPTLTLPGNVTWKGDCVSNGAPVISASKYYEVSIIDGYGKIDEY